MSNTTSNPDESDLAPKIAAVLAKQHSGVPLGQEDEAVLLVAAYRYLQDHGHEITPDLLPQLPQEHQQALELAREPALKRALDSLRQGKDSIKPSGPTR